MISTGNAFNPASAYPDWVEAETANVYGSIFSQIHDFDRFSLPNTATMAFRGLMQYTGRYIPIVDSINHLSCLTFYNDHNISFQGHNQTNFNLTAVVIDTLTAKLASIETAPQFVTNKGNVKGKKLGEEMNYLLKGLFHKHRLSHLIQMAFRDAMINRAGFLKIMQDDEKGINVERVMFHEMVVDPADGYYNDPCKVIHRKLVPVHVLEKLYPEHKEIIKNAMVMEAQPQLVRNYTPSVTLAEAYCKNTYKAKGRHTICLISGVILDEEWDKDYLPFVKMDYNEPVVGWMGNSVIDDLRPIQLELDRLFLSMQAILRLMSVPTWLLDSNAQMNKDHRTNEIGLMWEGDFKNGVAPILHNGAAMPPEIMQTIEFLIQQGYARAGLTPMDTQGQKPSGITSGEAIKTMVDQKSERWSLLQSNFEHKHIELASIILKELQGTKFKVSSLDRHIGLREVSTKLIPKSSDSYTLRMYPVSSLPDSIPDLIDSVSQMLAIGMISKEQVPELINMPDLAAETALQIAPRKLVDTRLEEMMDTGVYTNPEPYHDLAYASRAATLQYNFGQLNKWDEKILALLRRYIADVKELVGQVARQQQQQMAAAVPAPQQGPAQPSQPPQPQ